MENLDLLAAISQIICLVASGIVFYRCYNLTLVFMNDLFLLHKGEKKSATLDIRGEIVAIVFMMSIYTLLGSETFLKFISKGL